MTTENKNEDVLRMINEHNKRYFAEQAKYNRILEIQESEDCKRAYALHGDFYDCREVSSEDQEWFNNYVKWLREENETLQSFGVSLYLIYWSKYVTES